MTVSFCTDVYGHEIDTSLEELNRYGTGWLTYLDEDSYKERLNTLAEMTIAYGLDLLEKMSHEEEIIPTKAMAEKLFANPKQLSDDFIEEYQIKTEPERLEEIDEWFHIIKKLMIDSAESPYEEVQELLTKIAAFIGEKSCEMCSYKWYFPEHFKAPEVIGYPDNCVPLDRVVEAWKYKCDEQHWRRIEEQWKILKKGLAEKKNLILFEVR